ncbi:MAG: hypothetical protein ACRDO8_14475, partial [Nocardioidaceae bacterium]
MGQAGYKITPSALEAATHATGGYPFLIQLIGRGLCRSADNHQIDDDAVSRGVSWARRRLASLVHAPALQDLSDVDRTFLVAMAADDGPARQQDIAGRLNVSATYASQYRLRLLEAGLIQAVRHGYVDFAMPYMREYLREHAVVQAGSPEDSP